ncbi:MAG: ATP-dependent RecD-like DNA helicase [Blastocatellia bacterium]
MQPRGENKAAEGETHESMSGSVERVTFHNAENGWTVMRFLLPGFEESVTVTGNFSSISPGESLRLTGYWTTHAQYGDQFRAVDYQVTRPATVAGIQKYLGSGLIKGIGPVTAKRIVTHFGAETLDVIENDISRLAEVKGISAKKIAFIQKIWQEQRAIKDVMIFLQSHNVSTHFAVKIFKQYGGDSIAVVERTPYRLASEVHGIGFRTADQIARNLGVKPDAEARLRAGLQYVLGEASEQGHCFLPRGELLQNAATTLGVEDPAKLGAELETLLNDGQLKIEETTTAGITEAAIYLPPLWQSERSLGRRVRALLEKPVRVDEKRIAAWLDRYTASKGISLSDEQRAAVERAAASRVLVLTGGPGTGKTTTTRTIVALFQAMKKTVELASPTGRAAQRLSEVAGLPARTVHRLLEFDPSQTGFRRNDINPIESDVVIIDESSMLDLVLANHLIKAVSTDSQLILVGDVDQLPSVGPGTVLRDLIDSSVVPVARLTQVFRQAAESVIIQNAHRINRGEFPALIVPGTQETDCYFLAADEPEEVTRLIIKSVSESLPKRFGYNPTNDIQVLAPMNRGLAGATRLNEVLQQKLNPPAAQKPEMVRGSRVLRVGDKVIQRVNNYKLEVFNGDMGCIEWIDLEEQMIAVRFADRIVNYDYADSLELAHGFCVSVHKSQGSEYPAVIIPVHMQHFIMLSRNLLYTALTRARKTAVLIGTTKAIGAAMNNLEAVRRYTGLTRELRS